MPTKIEKSINLMNTCIDIKVYLDIPRVDVENAIDKAFNQFHSVVAKFTRFSESSELGILNNSNGKFVEISKELFELIKFGLDLGKQTKGILDITIIDLLEAYGYNKNYEFSKLDDPELANKIKALIKNRPGLEEIVLDEANFRIKLAQSQRIDLGAYGKGYAIRLAKDVFLNKKINNFIINAGGDIYAHGKDYDSLLNCWKVKILDPAKSLKTGKFEILTEECLYNEALACTGPWARKVKFFHHLIDPKTGKPANSKHTIVFVKHKDPMIADALATIKFLTKGKTNILLDLKI